MTGTLRNAVAIGFLCWCLTGAAPAEPLLGSSGLDVPGEGIRGSLLDDQAWTHRPMIRLEVEELDALGLGDDATGDEDFADADLPPILINVRTVYYEEVAVAQPAAVRRRRSMASRGAAAAPAPVVRYKTVARSGYRDLNITPIITKYARKHRLDPWLLRGVIEVESAFRPYAVSPAGAGGLMQLMPGTASYLGCGDRFDPEQNIAAGARYLRMMLDRFGSYELAIAAYNAGPGNVERCGGIPPFAETRNYVVKVTRAWKRGPSKS